MEKGAEVALRKNGYIPGPLIGKGGYSHCYIVESMRYPGITFVCKIMCALNEKCKETYNSEVSMHLSIMNVFVINLYDHFVDGKYMFIILEHCKNGPMKCMVTKENPMNPEKLFDYARQILQGLYFMHSNNIAHHDIKPSNLYIDENGRAKLGDLGISRKYRPRELSCDYRCTMQYAAPEVLRMKPYDPFKADIWSFGMSLYYLAVGTYPFITDSKESHLCAISSGLIKRPENLPRNLSNLMMVCFHMNPVERPSAEYLLQNFFDDSKITAFRPHKKLQSTDYCRSGRILQIRTIDKNKPTRCVWKDSSSFRVIPHKCASGSFSFI